MEFRCGNSSRVPHFSCFHSQECFVSSVIGEFCVCPDGWTHDIIGYGRFFNCGLPSTFLKNYFITYMVLSSLLFPIAFYQMKTSTAKGRVVYIGRVCILWSFCAWLNVVTVYAQDGFFEGGLITFGLVCFVGFALAAYTLPLLLFPIAQKTGSLATAHRIANFAALVATGEIITILVFLILAYPHVRDPDPTIYNLYMLEWLLQADIVMIIGSLATLLLGVRLRTVLKSIPNTIHVSHQVLNVILFQILLQFGGLVVICFTTLWIVFHSAPLMAIAWILQNSILLILLPLAVPLFSSYARLMKPGTSKAPMMSGSADIEVPSSEQKFTEQVIPVPLMPFSPQTARRATRARKKFTPKFMSRITEKEEESSKQNNNSVASKVADIIS